MIGLLQRVSRASVQVDGTIIGSIDHGLLVLIGVQHGDGQRQARRLAERILAYRVFEDDGGRMNLDVTQVNGSVLLVPQFTLAADTRRGNRASLAGAADPGLGKALFDTLIEATLSRWTRVQTGEFGANMSVSLCNEGPVTFWLEVAPE
jgi:D-tyrosyl-tRNA(Tyr) deacylase